MASFKVMAGGTEYTIHGLDKLELWEQYTGWIEDTRRTRICRGVNEKDREAVRQRERGLDLLAEDKAEGKLDYSGQYFLAAFNTDEGFRKALEICVDAKDKAAAVAAMDADKSLEKTLYRQFAEASGFFVGPE